MLSTHAGRILAATATALLLVGAGCGGNNTDSSAPAAEQPQGKTSAPQGQKTDLTGAMVKAMYFDAEIEVAVKNVTLNYLPANGTPADDGKQYVRVELSVTNAGKKPFKVNSTTYRLKTSAAELADYAWILESAMPDFLPDKELPPGESVTGALAYEVPTSETLDTMSLVYEGAISAAGVTETKQYMVPFKK